MRFTPPSVWQVRHSSFLNLPPCALWCWWQPMQPFALMSNRSNSDGDLPRWQSPAGRLAVFAGQVERGLRGVVELEAALPRLLRVAGRALRELVEAGAVLVVVGVALLAAGRRLALAERLAVTLLTRQLGVFPLQRVAGVLAVIEPDLVERAERRRVAQLALLGAENSCPSCGLSWHWRTRRRRTWAGLNRRLRVALGARDVAVGPLERHRGLRLVVVVEVERRPLRLPRRLAVATLAPLMRLADVAVRLLLLVAGAAGRLGPEERAQPLLVDRLVAVGAVGRRVFPPQRPAGQIVVERLHAAERAPAHEVELATAVVLVAQLAGDALDLDRDVQALALGDAPAQVLVVVTAQALGAGDRVVGLVARAALIRRVERGVAARQLARRGLEEVLGRGRVRAPGQPQHHQPEGEEPEPPRPRRAWRAHQNSAAMPSCRSWVVSMRRALVTPGCRTDGPDQRVLARAELDAAGQVPATGQRVAQADAAAERARVAARAVLEARGLRPIGPHQPVGADRRGHARARRRELGAGGRPPGRAAARAAACRRSRPPTAGTRRSARRPGPRASSDGARRRPARAAMSTAKVWNGILPGGAVGPG